MSVSSLMEKEALASHLDFANHHPNATSSDIRKLCKDVLKYGFNSAFVNGHHVSLARKLLKKRAKVGTVVSFPQGQDTTKAKVYAAADAARNGADVLDVSMNVGLFKEKNYAAVLKEMKAIVHAARKINKKIIIKFIIETGYLSSKEIIKASQLVVASGANFVKTCSGYGPRGAAVNDVTLIRKAVKGKVYIKVAGGISTTKQALAFLKEGAYRIGTSHAIGIVQGVSKKGASTKGE
jgi:deoxyribose-phosphate aldolase